MVKRDRDGGSTLKEIHCCRRNLVWVGSFGSREWPVVLGYWSWWW